MDTDSLVIIVAPNGAYKQLVDHPGIPLTSQALAQTARECLDQGAAMLHMHIRDSQGRHSLDVDNYRDAIREVRKTVGDRMVIQITSEAAGVYKAEAQVSMIKNLAPEAVSIGLREIDKPEIGELGLAELFSWLVREQVMTQIILYDARDLQRWEALKQRGIIPEARWFLLFVLGRYSTTQESRPQELLPFLEAKTSDDPWAVCAFGSSENRCVSAAAAFGGHVRVGFENNMLLKCGAPAPNNAMLVAQAANVASALGRRLATADDVREWFVP